MGKGLRSKRKKANRAAGREAIGEPLRRAQTENALARLHAELGKSAGLTLPHLADLLASKRQEQRYGGGGMETEAQAPVEFLGEEAEAEAEAGAENPGAMDEVRTGASASSSASVSAAAAAAGAAQAPTTGVSAREAEQAHRAKLHARANAHPDPLVSAERTGRKEDKPVVSADRTRLVSKRHSERFVGRGKGGRAGLRQIAAQRARNWRPKKMATITK